MSKADKVPSHIPPKSHISEDHIEFQKNTFTKGIDQYLIPFRARFLHELTSPKTYVMLICFIGGMLLAGGHLFSGLFLSLFPLYIVKRLDQRERKQNVDKCVAAISSDPELRNMFLTLMNAPQAMHTMDDKFEKAEWLNDIVKRIWPYYNGTVQSEIDRKGYTAKSESNKGFNIGSGHVVYFERFTLGDKPPVITHIGINKAATRLNEELVIELKMLYFGNCLLSFTKKTLGCITIKGGVKDIYFRGNARVVLRPLITESPYFGGLSFCLLERPIIDYDGINLANLADNKLFKNFLLSYIESILVDPNKLHFSFSHDPEITRKLKFSAPLYLCHFQIYEAENLPKMDLGKFFLFNGLADPFCLIRVGSSQFETQIVFNSINPYWGETHSAPVQDIYDQFKIDIYDKDALSADDFIGSVEFQIKDVVGEEEPHGKDKWVPIGKCISVEAQVPSPVIQLKFGGQTKQTQPKSTDKPKEKKIPFVFEESYHFMCNNPDQDVLDITIVDSQGTNFTKFARVDILRDDIIGTVAVHMSEVITEPTKQMIVEKKYEILKGTHPRGRMRLYLSFQIVDIEKCTQIYKNLQDPVYIKASAYQATSETSFFGRLLLQPRESLRHPIKTLLTLKHTTIPFVSHKPVAVIDDMSPAPPNVKNDCHVKIRVKWPERTNLHFEVLRVVNIPSVYSDAKHQFSITVKIGQAKTNIQRSHIRGRLRAFKGTFQSKKTQRYFHPSTEVQRDDRSVIINERLTFKIDPEVALENYEVHILLHAHTRMNICCSEKSVVASIIDKIPPVSHRSDPIERWIRLSGYSSKAGEEKQTKDIIEVTHKAEPEQKTKAESVLKEKTEKVETDRKDKQKKRKHRKRKLKN
ncbi:extended synaptotagmin-2-like protein [Leptotrombidium deliense]|uniref:Extended synaptotagmin-2-like protein n=1 Tax=Leptotrombidium deliense TaxID=299467 RepID=A0A443SGH6_9ACAR|nr:extended synaptotagmin-2-like protein [Leptotrombidium deliense]